MRFFLFIFPYFFFLSSLSGQSVEDIVSSYNNNIDPHNKMDSITHMSLNIIHKITSDLYGLTLEDTTSCLYATDGTIICQSLKDYQKRDIGSLVPASKEEMDNTIKTNLNYLSVNDSETFELQDKNDSVYVVLRHMIDKEIYYSISRENYRLVQKKVVYYGEISVTEFLEYQIFDDIRVPTKITFFNNATISELSLYNYRFIKSE